MAMSVGSSGGEPEVMMDINTTPLIDVMLVLIIMLIITIPVQLHSVNLNMPVGTPPPPLKEPVVVTVDIDFDGTVLWNGETVPDRGALEARLSRVAAEPDQPVRHPAARECQQVDHRRVGAVDRAGIGGRHGHAAGRDGRRHEEDEKRAHPVVAEALPHLRKEQRGQTARMSEEGSVGRGLIHEFSW